MPVTGKQDHLGPLSPTRRSLLKGVGAAGLTVASGGVLSACSDDTETD